MGDMPHTDKTPPPGYQLAALFHTRTVIAQRLGLSRSTVHRRIREDSWTDAEKAILTEMWQVTLRGVS